MFYFIGGGVCVQNVYTALGNVHWLMDISTKLLEQARHTFSISNMLHLSAMDRVIHQQAIVEWNLIVEEHKAERAMAMSMQSQAKETTLDTLGANVFKILDSTLLLETHAIFAAVEAFVEKRNSADQEKRKDHKEKQERAKSHTLQSITEGQENPDSATQDNMIKKIPQTVSKWRKMRGLCRAIVLINFHQVTLAVLFFKVKNKK